MDREDFQWKNKEHILELEQFQGKKGQGLPLLYFPLLLAHTGVKNCFTTREGGCSTGMFQSLNLSFTRGDNPQAVKTTAGWQRRWEERFRILSVRIRPIRQMSGGWIEAAGAMV